MRTIAEESNRVADVAHNAKQILDNLDTEFESKTKLNKVDVSFLFFATALQCVRQYLLTSFNERLDDKAAAEKANGGGTKETSDRSHRWYRPTLEEICTNPVPYDATMGSPDFDLGLGGTGKRFKALGHDPLLGYIFGTANIVTSTVTTWDLQSFHVKTGQTSKGHARDKVTNRADTSKVFAYTKDRLLDEGIEGKTCVGTALLKQWAHIKSDMYSITGLPIPTISTISPDFGRELAKYGIDMGNLATVGKQAAGAILINIIIAMIHYVFYDESQYSNRRQYEVKTRKILSYSNAIASASNIVYVAISEDFKKFDIGGMIVTIWRLISDSNFIANVKEEFVFGSFDKIIQGEEYSF